MARLVAKEFVFLTGMKPNIENLSCMDCSFCLQYQETILKSALKLHIMSGRPLETLGAGIIQH